VVQTEGDNFTEEIEKLKRKIVKIILKGRREMSKAHIRAAAVHFSVSPAVFL
jgi:hypothetical protein